MQALLPGLIALALVCAAACISPFRWVLLATCALGVGVFGWLAVLGWSEHAWGSRVMQSTRSYPLEQVQNIRLLIAPIPEVDGISLYVVAKSPTDEQRLLALPWKATLPTGPVRLRTSSSRLLDTEESLGPGLELTCEVPASEMGSLKNASIFAAPCNHWGMSAAFAEGLGRWVGVAGVVAGVIAVIGLVLQWIRRRRTPRTAETR